jgi:prophage regulatory protein
VALTVESFPIEFATEEGVVMGNESSGKSTLRILRIRQLRECIGLSRSTIYDRLNPMSPRYDSTFPRPIKLGKFAVGWVEEDIYRWIESRIEEARKILS